MKKALAILLAFSMLLSLTACGGKTAPASVSSESEQSTDSVEDAAKAESEAAVQDQDTDVNEPAAETTAAAAEETAQAAHPKQQPQQIRLYRALPHLKQQHRRQLIRLLLQKPNPLSAAIS